MFDSFSSDDFIGVKLSSSSLILTSSLIFVEEEDSSALSLLLECLSSSLMLVFKDGTSFKSSASCTSCLALRCSNSCKAAAASFSASINDCCLSCSLSFSKSSVSFLSDDSSSLSEIIPLNDFLLVNNGLTSFNSTLEVKRSDSIKSSSVPI